MVKFKDKVWNRTLKMNKLEICKMCGRVLQEKVKEPNKVVIIIKVTCKECKENEN
jgi:hypothetical protein